MSMRRKLVRRRHFFSPTPGRESPAKRFTSIADTTSWDFEQHGRSCLCCFFSRETHTAKSGCATKMSKLTITIDGPAGSGKSTVARRVAALLGYTYLDSGAMYRAVALKALKQNVSLGDEAGLEALARNTHIQLRPPTAEQETA